MQSEFELIGFRNQVGEGGKGVPDALIHSSCRILLETKTSRNNVSVEQLRRHLEKLHKSTELTRVLLVITPDEREPTEIADLQNEDVVWASFSSFNRAVDELFADTSDVISEREAFLLRELQQMFVQERFVATKDVVVVLSCAPKMSPVADIELRPGKGRDEEAIFRGTDRGHPA